MTAFPRRACYASNRSWGEPLWLPDLVTPNVPLLEKLARHDEITLDIAPHFSVDGAFKPEAILLLRRFNPKIRILPYYLVCHTWMTPRSRPASSFNQSVFDLLTATDGWVKNADGSLTPNGPWANQSKRAVSDGYTDLFVKVILSGLFDRGFFLDYCGMGWIGGNDDPGLRQENLTRMVRTLEKYGPTTANGIYANRLGGSGTMLEGYGPLGPLTKFEDARKAWAEGYESESWLQVSAFDNTTPQAVQAGRYGIGTACLFGAKVSVGYDRNQKVLYQEWWWREFDFPLGEPLGPARKLASGVWARDFARGKVLVNPGTIGTIGVSVGPGWLLVKSETEGLAPVDGLVDVPAQDARFLITTAQR